MHLPYPTSSLRCGQTYIIHIGNPQITRIIGREDDQEVLSDERWRECILHCIVSQMRKGRITARGLIYPVAPLDEGPAVWELIRNEPDKVKKARHQIPISNRRITKG